MKNTEYYWDRKTATLLYAGRYQKDESPYDFETWHNANASNLVITTIGDCGKFSNMGCSE